MFRVCTGCERSSEDGWGECRGHLPQINEEIWGWVYAKQRNGACPELQRRMICLGNYKEFFGLYFCQRFKCRETGRSWSKNILARAKHLPETSEGFRRRQHDELYVLENLLWQPHGELVMVEPDWGLVRKSYKTERTKTLRRTKALGRRVKKVRD